jgi:hypothetical protein
VYALLDNRVAPRTQRLTRLIPTWLYLCLGLRRLCARGTVRSHRRHIWVCMSSSTARDSTDWDEVARLGPARLSSSAPRQGWGPRSETRRV